MFPDTILSHLYYFFHLKFVLTTKTFFIVFLLASQQTHIPAHISN